MLGNCPLDYLEFATNGDQKIEQLNNVVHKVQKLSIIYRTSWWVGRPIDIFSEKTFDFSFLFLCSGFYAGSRLLNHVLDLCAKQNITEIYLHVQTNNDDAINFYKKFGFEITETIQNYYANITPPDCYVLTKYIQTHTKK